MPPTKKNLKATRKFEKKHLSKVLEKRKADVKIKQRQQIKTKKQAKRAKDAAFYKSEKEGDAAAAAKAKASQNDANVSAMSVDDFFKGGFEIIDKDPKGEGKIVAKGKDKATKAAQLGKRKRDGQGVPPLGGDSEDGDDAGDLSDMSLEEQPVVSDSDDDLGSEAGEEGAMSKKAMDDLAKKDPSFYKFLKEHDPEALDFDENADLAEIDELSAGSDASDSDEQPKKKQKKAKKKKKKTQEADDNNDSEDEFASAGNELTVEMVAKWKKALEDKKSLRAARQVVLAFRCAAHLNEEEDDGKNSPRYTINSPQVYHDILICALRQIPEVVASHLPARESASGKVYVTADTGKFKTLSIMLKSYTASVMHLLTTISDDATLKLTIGSIEPLLPYLLSFRKLLKHLVKSIVGFWARPASSEATRMTAFLVLRRLMVIGDQGIRETTLKAVYQGLVSGTRATNANTLAGINLMKNSAADLWGIDYTVGYQTAFGFIRQLAIHLRNSIVNNKNAAYRIVYNWQYTHSLDFWSIVLSTHCRPSVEAESGKENQLRLLIYPLVQVTLGAARLIPTATYFPLRFHLIRALNRIALATKTFIPIAYILLEVLESAEMRRAPKSATLKPLDFRVAYKAPKAYLRTRVYQDGVGEQVTELFADYCTVWCKNIAFPEMTLPIIIQLKRWLKIARRGDAAQARAAEADKKNQKGKGKGKKNKKNKAAGGNRNPKVTAAVTLLVQKIEANGEFITAKRATVDFAPADRAQVDAFLSELDWEKTPMGAFVVGQRKMREEKQRLMDEARRDDERRRRAEKGLKEGEEVLSEEELDEDEDDEDDDFEKERREEEEFDELDMEGLDLDEGSDDDGDEGEDDE